jgi:hypothetical protein
VIHGSSGSRADRTRSPHAGRPAGVWPGVGYEDLDDHDHLRHDQPLAVMLGKLEAKRSGCAPIAGKSTLHRLN